jgi:ferredoxin
VKVVIDPELCHGHGRCYMLAPEVFEADDRGHGQVVAAAELPPELLKKAELAAANCPERAITVSS